MENKTEAACVATASISLGVVGEVALLRNSWSGQNGRVSQASGQEGRRGWGGSRAPPSATDRCRFQRGRERKGCGADERKWEIKTPAQPCGEGETEVRLRGAWPQRTMGHGVPVRCGCAAPGADHGAGPAPSAPCPPTRNHNASPVTSQTCPKALLFRFL